MFTGHYAAAFAAKGAAPRVPLWLLFVAVQLVDIAWAVFVFAGIEHLELDPTLPSNPLVLSFMPYTHSLLATALWSGAAWWAAIRWLPNALGGAWRGPAAAALAAAVASHWFADLLVHRPDLAIVGEHWKLGFGLWNRPRLATALETGLVLAAALWCARRLAAPLRPRVLAVAAVLALLQLGMHFGGSGALPAEPTPMVATALFGMLLLPVVAAGAMRGAPRQPDLFHIAEPEALAAWQAARGTDPHAAYRPASFESEGFVHCSTAAQLAATLRRHYAGRGDLEVLELDSARLSPRVLFEDTSGRGEAFPHVYGPIDAGAVVSRRALPPVPSHAAGAPKAGTVE